MGDTRISNVERFFGACGVVALTLTSEMLLGAAWTLERELILRRECWLEDWREFCAPVAARVAASRVKRGYLLEGGLDGKLRFRETPGRPRPRRCPECGCVEWHVPDCFITYQPEGYTERYEEVGVRLASEEAES